MIGEATAIGLPVVFTGTGAASVLIESSASGVTVDPAKVRSGSDLATSVAEAARSGVFKFRPLGFRPPRTSG